MKPSKVRHRMNISYHHMNIPYYCTNISRHTLPLTVVDCTPASSIKTKTARRPAQFCPQECFHQICHCQLSPYGVFGCLQPGAAHRQELQACFRAGSFLNFKMQTVFARLAVYFPNRVMNCGATTGCCKNAQLPLLPKIVLKVIH